MLSAVITCVAATSPRVEHFALLSLRATAAEFPHALRIAALDVATPAVEAECERAHWTVLRLTSGAPPRMGKLLKAAVDQMDGMDFIWTIEHDVCIGAGMAAPAEALLARHPASPKGFAGASPELAGVELRPFDSRGRPGYPLNRKRTAPFPGDPALLLQRPWASLNCVCWRASVLRKLDWTKIRNYPATDQDISRQVLAAGREVAIADKLTCIHYFSQARRDLAEITRAHYAMVPEAWKEPVA